jgi:hypothetical protein
MEDKIVARSRLRLIDVGQAICSSSSRSSCANVHHAVREDAVDESTGRQAFPEATWALNLRGLGLRSRRGILHARWISEHCATILSDNYIELNGLMC